MLNRAKAVRRNAELEATLQTFRHQRDVLKVGQEHALGLVVGVADVAADLTTLAGQFADAGHVYSRSKKILAVCTGRRALTESPGERQVAPRFFAG
ncbi:hypothetical protein PP1Y_AT37023 [Novosphingobium sp. PP1Y]|nr:hypothetical protein PP1Y_AT37023 [Novosphingobium sp. PP1Y]